mgnify:CR=1 FL=1
MEKQLQRSKIVLFLAASLIAVGLFMHFTNQPMPEQPTYQTKAHLPQSHVKYAGALGVGEEAPRFALPDHNGEVFSLEKALEKGPVVLTFFRGNWCPICAAHLKSLSLAKDKVNAHGGQLVALSAQTPAKTALTQQQFGIDFPVLSDPEMQVTKAYGVGWQIPEEDRPDFKAWLDKTTGQSLNDYQVTGEYTLPVPATYVIAPGGEVIYAHVDEDYRDRAEPEKIIEALKAIN